MGQLWLSGPLEKSLGKSEYWLWAVVVAVIVNVLMTTVLMTLAFPKQSVIQKLTDKLNSITRESLTGIRVVRAYNAEDYQDKKFEAANDEVTRLNLFVNRLMAIMNPIMMAISSGLSLAIYWIGAYIINDASLAERLPLFSDMVVFMSYAMQVVMGFLLMGEHSLSFFLVPWFRQGVSIKYWICILLLKILVMHRQRILQFKDKWNSVM